MAADNDHWRGVPITEIYGSQSPWGAPEFPLVVPSFNHTVLYHIPTHGGLAGDTPPKPQIGHDKWDQEHVRMPCSSHSLYPVEDQSGETHLKKRWEIIETALWKPIRNSQELADAILSYNTKFKKLWKFRALHKLFNEELEEEESRYFFDVTLPEMAKLALSIKTLIQAPIPLLKQHKNKSVSLSQQQAASILANAFFCTFPRRNTTKRDSEYASYPHINFNTLYNANASDDVMEKLKCICYYFRRVCAKVPVGVLTFSRRSVPPAKCPQWMTSDTAISTLPVHVDPVTNIEDASGLIQVDFANKYLGGGVLGHGSVQEEIRFVICPELMVSMLFTEVLRPNEALMMIGAERYCNYTGYGYSFTFAGGHSDSTVHDTSMRRRTAVLAIDAAPYGSPDGQYTKDMIMRELNKAWVGISFYTEESSAINYPGLATGNWGCGAFGGNPQLKSLIQIMASSEARRPMAYYTFQDVELRDEIVNMYNLLSRHNVTVGQLYKYLLRFSTTDVRKGHLHPYIYQVLRDEESSRSCKTNETQEENKEKTDNEKDNKRQSSKVEVDSKMETMDTSNISFDINDASILLNTDSPDLFSQDEGDLQEIRIETNSDGSVENKPCYSKDIKMADENKMASNQTSRLFDEMQKFDDVNGKLNLSMSNSNNDLDINSSKIKLDYSPDVKKRMTKKITDYFIKKPI